MVGLGAFCTTHGSTNREFAHKQRLISGIQRNASYLAEPHIQNCVNDHGNGRISLASQVKQSSLGSWSAVKMLLWFSCHLNGYKSGVAHVILTPVLCLLLSLVSLVIWFEVSLRIYSDWVLQGYSQASCCFSPFFLPFTFFSSSSSLYVKGEDEICLCQTLDAVKNRHL